ncbi:hypothetical protein DL763_010968 [Monosporascus cannonballus]|nr:hypothetical protein DL763_010968 [Monosporascus cannonballus]
MSSKKVLVILSDANSFPLHNAGADGETVQQPSGFFLMELAKPLQKLLDAGYEVTRENGFGRPRRFRDVPDEELRGFAGVFVPGGHAPLADLGAAPELGRILAHFHAARKPTAAICHGPYAFLSTKHGPGKDFAYRGYRLTSWSDAEEKVMETVLRGEIDKVESSLRESGAEMVEGLGEKAGAITVDREVVTGGNPMAADALGNKFLEMLKA